MSLRPFFYQIAAKRIQVIPSGVFSFGSPPELLDSHEGNTAESEPMSCGRRDINNSPANKRTAIVDANNYGMAISPIGYARLAPDRKRTMRGGQCSGMGSLAACSPPAYTDAMPVCPASAGPADSDHAAQRAANHKVSALTLVPYLDC